MCQWISVEERLPTVSPKGVVSLEEWVFVLVSNDLLRFADISLFYAPPGETPRWLTRAVWQEGGFRITHWMPIPPLDNHA